MNVDHAGNFEDVAPLSVPTRPGNAISQELEQLIDSGQREKARELLEAEILKGMDSGPPEPWTEEDLASIRAEVIRRYEARIAGR
jgi:hypothetical protein